MISYVGALDEFLAYQCRNVLAENYIYENYAYRKQILNINTVMNLIKSEKHFHYLFQESLQSYNPSTEATKIKV